MPVSNYHRAESVGPDQTPDIRIAFLDALRGFALLGIYWINVTVFADDANSMINSYIGIQPFLSDVLSGGFTEDIIEGTMRGLFSLLFGASAIVFLNETRLTTQGLTIVDRYYRRALLLILFGIAHAYLLLWPYDVLYIYGVISMLLFPIRRISSRILVLIGIVLLIIGDINITEKIDDFLANHKQVTQSIEQIEKSTARENVQQNINYSDNDVAEDNPPEATVTSFPGYWTLFRRNISNVVDQQSETLYSDYIFDVGGMMIIGIALLKMGILSGERRRRFYFVMMVLGYGLGYIARDAEVYYFFAPMLEWPVIYDSGLAGYNVGRLIVTLGHIGLLGLLMKLDFLSGLITVLAALGRLALTNYIMQTVLSLFIFYVLAEWLFDIFTFMYVIYILIAVWLFQIAFSLLWLRYFRLGPLEWLWRTLIYGQRQALRRPGPARISN